MENREQGMGGTRAWDILKDPARNLTYEKIEQLDETTIGELRLMIGQIIASGVHAEKKIAYNALEVVGRLMNKLGPNWEQRYKNELEQIIGTNIVPKRHS